MSQEPRQRWRTRVRSSLPWTLPLLAYVLLSLGGVTQSNLGALHQGSSAVPHQIGTPQAIRSDEFMTETPIWLGWMTSGGRGVTDPLSVPPNFFAQLPSGPVSALVFFDGTLSGLVGPWFPNAILFAARWWLPTLLLMLGLPTWFRQLTGSRRWGWAATALIFFAPSNQWWSGRPVNTLGFMFAAAALMVDAQARLSRGRSRVAALEIVAAAVLIARFPSYYQPFAIVLGFPVLLSTAAFLARQPVSRTARAWAVLGTGALAAALTAGTMLESLSAIRSGLGTVYPGQRVSTGTHEVFGFVFGAPLFRPFDHLQSVVPSLNATEASSSFTVLLLVALLVGALVRWRGPRGTRAAWWVWVGFGVAWLAWCQLPWGPAGRALPLMNLVPAHRAGADVGYLGIIALCLTLASVRRPRWSVALAAGVLTGAVCMIAGWSWRHYGLPLGVPGIVVSSVVAGLLVGAAVRWPRRLVPVAALAVASALLTVDVNPLVAGLGDLRGSSTARAMIVAGRAARADHTIWASDVPEFDALMFATGTPAMSSRQQIGPFDAQWLRLDPGGTHRDVWNRGGSYIRFRWTNASTAGWTNPATDSILVRISPCALARLEPRLGHIASRRPLDLPCLRPEGSLPWAGLTEQIYAVRRSGPARTDVAPVAPSP